MGEFNYSREELEGFFKWQETPLEHFPEEVGCEEQARDYALSRPRSDGYISFKSKYRGKRYFWIKNGQAEEIDPMECYLKSQSMKYSKAKERIHKVLFKD